MADSGWADNGGLNKGLLRMVYLAKLLPRLRSAAFIALMLFVSLPLLAAPAVTADVALNFGVLAVKSNDAVSTLTVSSGGAVSFTGEVIPIGGAVRGEYRLTGFPPGVLLDVTLDDATLSAGGGGSPEFLTVTNYQNPTLLADAAGEAVVPIGATLQTSASTVMYVEADSEQVAGVFDPDQGALLVGTGFRLFNAL